MSSFWVGCRAQEWNKAVLLSFRFGRCAVVLQVSGPCRRFSGAKITENPSSLYISAQSGTATVLTACGILLLAMANTPTYHL